MGNKVTYLLGAGASANCLPVVSEMAKRIKLMRQRFDAVTKIHLENEWAGQEYKLLETINQGIKGINEDLIMLIEKCEGYSSIDTYAKKVFLGTKKNNHTEDEYNRLKKALSVYFTLEQWCTSVDKRYDNFWASILNIEGDLPKDFTILSWNYDSQLELSYANFFELDLEIAYKKLSMKAFRGANLGDSKGFSVFKLNGSARCSSLNNSSYLVENYPRYKKEQENVFLLKLIKTYAALSNEYDIHLENKTSIDLFFAWEHVRYRSLNENYYEDLQKSILGTNTLAIIGYSFPFFNRNVDDFIINRTIGQTLNKIYIQDLNPEDIEERLRSVLDPSLNPEIVLIRDKNQFIFPNELTI